MRAVILVPRRNDNGWRDKLWAHCRQIWADNYPEMEIFEGYHVEGPFNRSAAINTASDLAGDWDVALIIDSDTISDPDCVKRALDLAVQSGGLVVAHSHRHMLSEGATRKILAGDVSNWKRGGMIRKTFRDSVSCAVAISRKSWDTVGGFDERFVGWGFEDTAFHIAIEAISGLPVQIVPGDCFHLHHPVSPETSIKSPTYKRNLALKRRYEAVRWQPQRLLRFLGQLEEQVADGTIPRILHRTVPENTSDVVEGYWERFGQLHPDWDLRTYREPIDPADWPMTGQLFAQCQNGAQKAGLIRLEAIYTHGGVYVDSDCEPMRPLDSLLHVPAFAGWEDEKVVPDAVLGGCQGHPVFMELIGRAREAIENGQDAWHSGPGGTTEILPGRDDVLLLPPGAFYPAHYLEKGKLGKNHAKPWVFLEHKWHHSWGSDSQKAGIEAAQRERPKPGVPRARRGETPMMVFDDAPVKEKHEVDPGVRICIPWNDSKDEWRQRSFDWCKRYWLEAGATVIVGDGPSRSAMRNHAARIAIESGAKVLFFADSDTWVPIKQLNEACEAAVNGPHLVHAYNTYTRLSSTITARGQKESQTAARLMRQGQVQRGHMSGASAISVEFWHEMGGYDERFTEWGYEDRCFDLAARTLGSVERVNGPAIHWFHTPADGKGQRRNAEDPATALALRYCQAAGVVPERGQLAVYAKKMVPKWSQPDPGTMRAILSEIGGPRALSAPATTPWGPPVVET